MKSKPSSKKHRSVSRQGAGKVSKYSLPAACMFGVCVALVTALFLAIVCAIICSASGNAYKLLTPLSFVSTVAVYFVCGFATAKRYSAAIPAGAISGAVLCILFFIVSLFLSSSLASGTSLPVSLLIRLSFVVVSMLGAILGANAKKKVRRHR
jgi:putative membrane protein (TIGR04086 family)